MNRRDALAATFTGGLVVTGATGLAGEPRPADQPARLTDAERQALEEGGPVVTKVFVVALREQLGDEKAAKLRKFIDPRYLKEHRLQDGVFPIQRVVTGDIHSNDLTDDPSTALVVADTEGGVKECFLFRLTVHEGEVYIAPQKAPDKKSKLFKPWIYRLKV
jgi:hypothetical protein